MNAYIWLATLLATSSALNYGAQLSQEAASLSNTTTSQASSMSSHDKPDQQQWQRHWAAQDKLNNQYKPGSTSRVEQLDRAARLYLNQAFLLQLFTQKTNSNQRQQNYQAQIAGAVACIKARTQETQLNAAKKPLDLTGIDPYDSIILHNANMQIKYVRLIENNCMIREGRPRSTQGAIWDIPVRADAAPFILEVSADKHVYRWRINNVWWQSNNKILQCRNELALFQKPPVAQVQNNNPNSQLIELTQFIELPANLYKKKLELLEGLPQQAAKNADHTSNKRTS